MSSSMQTRNLFKSLPHALIMEKKFQLKCQSLNQQSSCMFLFRDDSCPGSGMPRSMVSQWYGNGITMLSKLCHNGVTMLSQWCRPQANNLHQRIINNIVPSVHWIWNQNFTRTFVPKHYCKDGKLSVEVLEGWRIQIVPWQLIQVYNMQTQPFGIRITHSSFLFSTSAQIVNMMSMHWVEVLSFIYQQSFWAHRQEVINVKQLIKPSMQPRNSHTLCWFASILTSREHVNMI